MGSLTNILAGSDTTVGAKTSHSLSTFANLHSQAMVLFKFRTPR